MRVFLSWSGEPSRSVALALKPWLRKVLQTVEPWMSDEDLQKGGRWHQEISEALRDTTYGLVCLTKSNQSSPWLNFEAGALSKEVGERVRVVAVLIDMQPADITTPLKEFQTTALTDEDFRRTIQQLNKLTENPLTEREVDEQFDVWWPKLVTEIEAARAEPSEPPRRTREVSDMLEEVLEMVRALAARDTSAPPEVAAQHAQTLSSRIRGRAADAAILEVTDRLAEWRMWPHVDAYGTTLRVFPNDQSGTPTEAQMSELTEIAAGRGYRIEVAD
jgi:hypothetical protein